MSQFYTQTSGGGGGGGGDVNGPGGAVSDQAIARWDGTTGTQIEGSNVFLNDAGSINFLASGALQGITFGADANTNIREPTADNLVVTNAGVTTATFTSGNLLTLANPLAVVSGGTGRATLTDGAVLIGDGTNPVEMLTLTNGQILIGSTGVSPVATTITAGTGITVTNGAGTITISAAGSITGSGPTADATPTTILTQAAGVVAGVYQIEVRVAAFASALPAGAGFYVSAAVRTTGGAATLIDVSDSVSNVEAALAGITAVVTVSANNFIVVVTGLGGTAINWKADLEYTFVS